MAEKIAAMSAKELFAERRARADLAAFDRIINRQAGDELPPDLTYLSPTG